MPTDAEIATEKRRLLGGKSTADSTVDLVVPRMKHKGIPDRTKKAFPELHQWNEEQNQASEEWRQQLNTALNHATTNSARTTQEIMQAKIDDLQAQIDALTP